MSRKRIHAGSAFLLITAAISSGAIAGLLVAGFIWFIDEGTRLVWQELPEQIGVEPFNSWWMFAILIGGGALVGLGQIVFGNYPISIGEAIATWRKGEMLEPEVAPKTVFNASAALIAGGPVGFEAALTGLIGGTATWIDRRIKVFRVLFVETWLASHDRDIPRTIRQLPYWLAGLSGLVVYLWLPFGEIDFGFRFDQNTDRLGVGVGLAAFGFAALVAIPAAWALNVVQRAEDALVFQRSPILIGMCGGAIVALLAVPDHNVLFAGTGSLHALPDLGLGDLAYLTVVKWVALCVALLAGWRGGPIFPTYVSLASLGLLVDEVLDVGPEVMMIAGISVTAIVFTKGSLPFSFLLTLYVVPFSYTGLILAACAGGAAALAIGAASGWLPKLDTPEAADPDDTAPLVTPTSDS